MRNTLPSAGVFWVSASGIVRAHTSVLSTEPSRAISRNFFEEVAPSSNCAEFRGRFESLLARGGGTESFTFRLRYPWIQADVRVHLVACNDRGAWILIADPTSAAAFAEPPRAPRGAEDRPQASNPA